MLRAEVTKPEKRGAHVMSKRWLLTICVTAQLSWAAKDKPLYVVTGTVLTGGTGQVRLYRISSSDGGASLVASLARGLDRVLTDTERRRLIVASPPSSPHTFSLLDMDSPESFRIATIDYAAPDAVPGHNVFLLDIPNAGEVVALGLTRASFASGAGLERNPVVFTPPSDLKAISVTPGDPKPKTLPLSAIQFLRFEGIGGPGSGEPEGPYLRGDPLGLLGAGPRPISIGLVRPSAFAPSTSRESYPLLATNDTLTALYGDHGIVQIFDKINKVWVEAPSEFTSTRVRAFGPWLAAVAEQMAAIPASTTQVDLDPKRNGIEIHHSPGAAMRSKESIDPQTTVEDLFEQSLYYFPGKLLLYNFQTHALIEIDTEQGDSEVLLVDEDRIYYRVNDAVYAAPLAGGTLGKPKKLAEGGDMFQAHWAFLGR